MAAILTERSSLQRRTIAELPNAPGDPFADLLPQELVTGMSSSPTQHEGAGLKQTSSPQLESSLWVEGLIQ